MARRIVVFAFPTAGHFLVVVVAALNGAETEVYVSPGPELQRCFHEPVTAKWEMASRGRPSLCPSERILPDGST